LQKTIPDMQKILILGILTLFTQAGFSQQHFLDHGTIAPCHYTGHPTVRITSNNVTVMLKEEIPVYSHVCGKVVSVFKVADQWNALVKTKDNLYVNFGNLRYLNVKRGDDIQQLTQIGMPLPGEKSGTWELLISYDNKEGSLSCEKAIEMIKGTQAVPTGDFTRN
jgi:hypothetical protein